MNRWIVGGNDKNMITEISLFSVFRFTFSFHFKSSLLITKYCIFGFLTVLLTVMNASEEASADELIKVDRYV